MPDFKFAIATLLLAASAVTLAAETDAGALALQPEVSAEGAPTGTKLFLEGAVGSADQRYGLGSRTISRASVDFRHASRLNPSTQAVFSARVDATDPADPRIDGAVLSLREAYLGWQDEAATRVLEFGRINLREGPGYGYNPTDFFRDNALRTITTVNPFTLRENRLGSVMLRGQQSWSGGSVALVYSPKLETRRSNEAFNADLGSTNALNRGLVSLSNRLSDEINTQILLYKEAGAPTRVGASFTALVSQAAVAHAEWSHGREPDLLSRALMQPGEPESRHRLAAGMTYTTATRLSVTAEYQYNGFALDRDAWQALATTNPALLPAYMVQSLALQDNAARKAWLVYAVQRDMGLKNLDLTALVKFNRSDSSRMVWLDLRYRLTGLDVALQFQRNTGIVGSEFGTAPIRSSAGIVGTVYF
ncbi:MAG: hypothetical protein Q8K96_00675 [Rubrivivax sp.]|nr:hypothetical protein [Rubrivivax sp.]